MKAWLLAQVWLLKFWLRRLPERLAIWLAWRLPRLVVRWCACRVLAHATSGCWGNECPDEVSGLDAMVRWEAPNGDG